MVRRQGWATVASLVLGLFQLGYFQDLGAFAKFPIGSAIMMCLEYWFYMFPILLVGQLKKAEVAAAAISIYGNLFGRVLMVLLGFNAAISVRKSNELGAGRPRAASFQYSWWSCPQPCSVSFSTLVLILKDVYGVPFANSRKVIQVVDDLVLVFTFTLLFNSVQPIFTGAAVRAWWQWLVAYINLGCYYVVGIPLGYLLAIKFDLGVKGM